MSTKFTRNNLPQKPPPVCKAVDPPPNDPVSWPGTELLASVHWELGNVYTGYNTADAIITLRTTNSPMIFQGQVHTPAADVSISVSIDTLHRVASIVAYAMEPDGDSHYLSWADQPIYPHSPLRIGALVQPRTQFQGAAAVTIRGPKTPQGD